MASKTPQQRNDLTDFVSQRLLEQQGAYGTGKKPKTENPTAEDFYVDAGDADQKVPPKRRK